MQEYQQNFFSKRNKQAEYLDFITNCKKAMLIELNDCEKVVRERMGEDIRRPNIEYDGSITTFLRAVDRDISDGVVRILNHTYDSVKYYLKDLDLSPYVYQLGSAYLLYLSLSSGKTSPLHLQRGKHTAALLSLPPATGKSMIVCLLCALVCQGKQDTVDQIVISFTNEVLYEKDRKLYEGLQQVF